MNLNRAFRKYHRAIAIAASLPLILTVLTGVGYTLFDELFEIEGAGSFFMGLHTMSILRLEGIYPLLNGLGLIGLLVTGLSMTGLLGKRQATQKPIDKS